MRNEAEAGARGRELQLLARPRLLRQPAPVAPVVGQVQGHEVALVATRPPNRGQLGRDRRVGRHVQRPRHAILLARVVADDVLNGDVGQRVRLFAQEAAAGFILPRGSIAESTTPA